MAPREERLYAARAEMVLALDDSLPLRALASRPDPLTALARAMGRLRSDFGEAATVAIDLIPVRRRRRWAKQARSRHEASRLPAMRRGSQTVAKSVEVAAGRQRTKELGAKLSDPDPLFCCQVLVKVVSRIKGRPQEHLRSLLGVFAQQSGGRNAWAVAGQRIGPIFLGADTFPWRRRHFDRRFDTGAFDPSKKVTLTLSELSWALRPPTAHCQADNVLRSSGGLDRAAESLPEYRGQPDLLPLGKAEVGQGLRMVGVPLRDTFFAYLCGRSRWGKTELALCQLVALARAGQGCLFLDPHRDGIERIKPYLTDLADRLIVLDLGVRTSSTQIAWNPFSMQGRGLADVEDLVDAIADAFACALGWGTGATRATALATVAVRSLLELAMILPPELAPTIFQLTSLLSNDPWREAVMPHLSAASQDFFAHRFDRLAGEAITPITNLIDRLRASEELSALLGCSRSTYSARQAMDEGKIVLASTGGVGPKGKLLANLLLADVFQGALGRRNIAPEHRRPFWTFLDEAQTYDAATRGIIPALLEQGAKYGLRAVVLNQNPERLTEASLEALTTNRSHLITTAVNMPAAKLLAQELGGKIAPEALAGLERYSYMASVTFNGRLTPPFRLRGVSVEELWGEHRRPEAVAALEEAIASNVGCRPVAEVLAELATLDQRILAYLRRRRSSSGGLQDLPYAEIDEDGDEEQP